MTSEALLLVGHGTRDAAGQAEFQELARQVAVLLPQTAVAPCYLEFAEPTIATAIDTAAARGARRLTVAPVLLFAAGHAKQDIPAAVADAVARHSGMTVRQADPLSCQTKLIELSSARFRQSLAGKTALPDEETFLLLVGRGSRDADANSEMARFTRLRWELDHVGWSVACFLAMTGPTLEQGLSLAARSGLRRVVVQPHLLFQGELVQRIARQAREFAAGHPETDWVLAPHLGPDPLLAELVAERAESQVVSPVATGPPV